MDKPNENVVQTPGRQMAGEFVFLEVNCAGNFLFLEDKCAELRMTEAMCQFLESQAPPFSFEFRNLTDGIRLSDIKSEVHVISEAQRERYGSAKSRLLAL